MALSRGVSSLMGLMLLAAGCTGRAAAPDPYEPEIATARTQTTSAFERQVFADRNIDRGEYEEAVNLYVRCAREHGLDVVAIPQAQYFIYRVASQPTWADSVLDRCRIGTLELIEPIYVERLINPRKLNHDVLLVGCLRRRHLLPAGFTLQRFRKAHKDFGAVGVDTNDPRFDRCLVNPSLR